MRRRLGSLSAKSLPDDLVKAGALGLVAQGDDQRPIRAHGQRSRART
jgi:hypothetical protein